ncbi:hypothetical protein A4A49_10962 [Nicotiana attenuata]|uniref:Secreted protein n=1 Tax=Nicotiana attenuata TaxID=49451 RepID=A0A1J6IPZ0_NICAT|nr:hypothetical protein A4A49_10962 [Nicotiana attenuata]
MVQHFTFIAHFLLRARIAANVDIFSRSSDWQTLWPTGKPFVLLKLISNIRQTTSQCRNFLSKSWSIDYCNLQFSFLV